MKQKLFTITLLTPFIVIFIKVLLASIPEISEREEGMRTQCTHIIRSSTNTERQKVGCARFYLYCSGNCLEQGREPIKDTHARTNFAHTHTHTYTGSQTRA